MFDSLEKLLKDKKVVDAYTYYVSCAYKLYTLKLIQTLLMMNIT